MTIILSLSSPGGGVANDVFQEGHCFFFETSRVFGLGFYHCLGLVLCICLGLGVCLLVLVPLEKLVADAREAGL